MELSFAVSMEDTKFESIAKGDWRENIALMSRSGFHGVELAIREPQSISGFRDQLRRSAVSIASNIAEGKERETVREFIRFLYIAKGSAGEVKTQLYIAKEVGYLEESKYLDLNKKVEKISGRVGNLIKAIKRTK